jgi:hypothetical protein
MCTQTQQNKLNFDYYNIDQAPLNIDKAPLNQQSRLLHQFSHASSPENAVLQIATDSSLYQLDVNEISGRDLNIEFAVTYPFPSLPSTKW